MKNLFLPMLFIILVAGCISIFPADDKEKLKEIPEVKAFTSSHSSATVDVLSVPEAEITSQLDSIKEYCPQISSGDYYKVTALDPNTKETFIAWVDTKENKYICSTTTILGATTTTIEGTGGPSETASIPPTTEPIPGATTTTTEPPATASDFCGDNDESSTDIYGKAGVCTDKTGGHSDSCDGSQITEYSCSQQKHCISEIRICPLGCVAGACSKATAATGLTNATGATSLTSTTLGAGSSTTTAAGATTTTAAGATTTTVAGATTSTTVAGTTSTTAAGTTSSTAGGTTSTTSSATVPSVPQTLQATGGENQVSLSWSAPSSNGGAAIQCYKVFRSMSDGGSYSIVSSGGEVACNPSDPTGLSYTDSSVVAGVTYYYVVKALNSAGSSSNSNQASATPTIPTTTTAATTTTTAGSTTTTTIAQQTLGSTSCSGGSASNTFPTDDKYVSKFTLPSQATVSKLTLYVVGYSLASNTQQVMKGIIYAESGFNSPGALKGTTNEVVISKTQSAGWVDLTFSSPVNLIAGDYWFGLHAGGSNSVIKYYYTSLSSGTKYTGSDTYSDGAANTFAFVPSTKNGQICVYITYT